VSRRPIPSPATVRSDGSPASAAGGRGDAQQAQDLRDAPLVTGHLTNETLTCPALNEKEAGSSPCWATSTRPAHLPRSPVDLRRHDARLENPVKPEQVASRLPLLAQQVSCKLPDETSVS
jgi:hypothetical protein